MVTWLLRSWVLPLHRLDLAGQVKQAEEQFKNNRPAGTWREFYPDGKTPRKVETYGPQGKLVGERLTYFENGTVQSRQPYLNGFLAGVAQEYFPSGKVRKALSYGVPVVDETQLPFVLARSRRSRTAA